MHLNMPRLTLASKRRSTSSEPNYLEGRPASGLKSSSFPPLPQIQQDHAPFLNERKLRLYVDTFVRCQKGHSALCLNGVCLF